METVGELMVVITNRSKATGIPQLSTTDSVTLYCSETNLFKKEEIN